MAPSLTLAIRSTVLQINVSLSSRLHPQSYGKTKCVSKERILNHEVVYLGWRLLKSPCTSRYVQCFFHTGLECMFDVYATSILCVKAYVWVWVCVSVQLHWLNRPQLTSLRLRTPPQLACRELCPPAHPSGYLWTADQDSHQGWWLWFLPGVAPSQGTAGWRIEKDKKWGTEEGILYD